MVSDFGLIEAIEAGLVKIPFMPQSDNTQELDMPVLRNLYEHVSDELPKKGARKRNPRRKRGRVDHRRAACSSETGQGSARPVLQSLPGVLRRPAPAVRETAGLFTSPPVFIVVCNNTSVSKEVYKFIAGYEYERTDKNGNTVSEIVDGHYPQFSNYDASTRQPRHRPPTLLIDSDALENSDQINDEFKKSSLLKSQSSNVIMHA